MSASEVEWRRKHPIIHHICGVCSKKFTPSRNGVKYCSQSCARRGYYKNNLAFHKRNPLAKSVSNRRWRMRKKWNGNWYKALTRDSFTCQICGFTRKEPNSLREKKIVVHHIDGRGENRGNNHELANLQTLCHSRHRKIHKKLS